MPFRDDYQAALDHAARLEEELREARQEVDRDHERIAALERKLAKARSKVPEPPQEKGATPVPPAVEKSAGGSSERNARLIAIGVAAFFAFVFYGIPRIVTWHVTEVGYDFGETLERATREARGTASDAELSGVFAKYVDVSGRVRMPDAAARRHAGGINFAFLSRASASRAAATMLGAPGTRSSDCKSIRIEISPDYGMFTGEGVSSTTADLSGTDCASSTPTPPRCTLAQVWKRAIDAGAPSPAFATIELGTGHVGGASLSWTFEIVDRTTGKKVFKKTFPDDC
jgi:hypothetical protein